MPNPRYKPLIRKRKTTDRFVPLAVLVLLVFGYLTAPERLLTLEASAQVAEPLTVLEPQPAPPTLPKREELARPRQVSVCITTPKEQRPKDFEQGPFYKEVFKALSDAGEKVLIPCVGSPDLTIMFDNTWRRKELGEVSFTIEVTGKGIDESWGPQSDSHLNLPGVSNADDWELWNLAILKLFLTDRLYHVRKFREVLERARQ